MCILRASSRQPNRAELILISRCHVLIRLARRFPFRVWNCWLIKIKVMRFWWGRRHCSGASDKTSRCFMMSSRVECESESESPRSFFFAFRYDFLASKYFISRQDSRHCKAAAKEQVKLVYLLFFFPFACVVFLRCCCSYIFAIPRRALENRKQLGSRARFVIV